MIGKHGLLVFASIQCRKRSCEPTTEIRKAKERIPSKKPASRKSAQLLPYPDGPNVPLSPSRASSWLSGAFPIKPRTVAHGCCTRLLRARACLRSVFACLGLAAKAKCYYNPRLLRCRLGTLVCVGTIHILSPQRVGGEWGNSKADKRKGGFPDNDSEKGERGQESENVVDLISGWSPGLAGSGGIHLGPGREREQAYILRSSRVASSSA